MALCARRRRRLLTRSIRHAQVNEPAGETLPDLRSAKPAPGRALRASEGREGFELRQLRPALLGVRWCNDLRIKSVRLCVERTHARIRRVVISKPPIGARCRFLLVTNNCFGCDLDDDSAPISEEPND